MGTIRDQSPLLSRVSLGTDIESIARFRALDRKTHQNFLDKIFTAAELEFSYATRNPAEHLAVRFAAKEAVIKSYSSAGCTPPLHNQIEVLNDERGAPYVKVDDRAIIRITLSHCDDKAIAVAIREDVSHGRQ